MVTFECLQLSIDLIPVLRPLVKAVASFDSSLSDQIRRSASSIALNLSEGSKRQGKDRFHSFRIAAGSASETLTALQVASGWGWLDGQSLSEPEQILNRIQAMLWRLARPEQGSGKASRS